MSIVFMGLQQDWLDGMTNDIAYIENAKYINSDCPLKIRSNKVYGYVRNYILRESMNHIIQRFLFRRICEKICRNNEDELIIVFFDWNRLGQSRLFISFLKHYYKKLKLVFIFTNIVRISGASKHGVLPKLKEWYDIVYTFEEQDAKDYGFTFSQLFYSKYRFVSQEPVKNRVFFIGHSKDRYKKLLDIYSRLKDLQIESLFYITNVEEKDQIFEDGLIYNTVIPFAKVQELEMSSTCLLDFIQEGAMGYTYKVRAAVMNDKLLITNNVNIKRAPFYNPDYILLVEKPEDIKASFFDNPQRVHYSEADKECFSLPKFIETMKHDLYQN